MSIFGDHLIVLPAVLGLPSLLRIEGEPSFFRIGGKRSTSGDGERDCDLVTLRSTGGLAFLFLSWCADGL